MKWEGLFSHMNVPLKEVFNMIDVDIFERVCEIRLKRNGYITLVIRNTSYFIDYNGDLYDVPSAHCVKLGKKEFDELFLSLCDYSLHTHMDTLKNGYITLSGGLRTGVAGEAVYENGKLISVKNVTSLNVRLLRDVEGCSMPIVKALYLNSLPSIIVAGMPNSGKTTLLKDLAKQLSNGKAGRYIKTCIADERGELSNGAGINADILLNYPKFKAVEIASRTLSPDIIICDELADEEETKALSTAFACGAKFALSVHIGSRDDLFRKPLIKRLLETGEFSYIVLLEGHTYNYSIISVSEVISEICGDSGAASFNCGNRGALRL